LFKSFCRVVSVLTTLWKQFEFRLVRFVIYLTVSKNVKGIRSPTLRRFSFGSDKILFKWNRLILFGSTKLISINFFKTKKKKKWYYNENLADKSQVEPSFRSRCLGSRNYFCVPLVASYDGLRILTRHLTYPLLICFKEDLPRQSCCIW